MNHSRRKFLLQSAITTAGLSLVNKSVASFSLPLASEAYFFEKSVPEISIFSKNLQWLNYSDMAAAAANMGFNGIDLTVRPGGHVLPENVETDLPKAVEIIKAHGLNVTMITTGILDANDTFTEPILKTAARLGIKYYRLGWFNFDKTKTIEENIEDFNQKFLALQRLNQRYNLHGDYQNHAGENFGSAVIDLYMGFKKIEPAWLGCQYDIRHATVEGANSWPIGLNLLKNYIKTINIKDFKWTKLNEKWVAENVPLGQGMVDFKKYFQLLNTVNFRGPICLHYEYELGGAENGATAITIPREKIFTAMKSDLTLLRKLLAEANIG